MVKRTGALITGAGWGLGFELGVVLEAVAHAPKAKLKKLKARASRNKAGIKELRSEYLRRGLTMDGFVARISKSLGRGKIKN